MPMVEVVNLATLETRTYVGVAPRTAVIAAYAQTEKKDHNTWAYEDRYGHLVVEGKVSLACGDWGVLKSTPVRRTHYGNH